MSDPTPTRPVIPTAASIARELELLHKAKDEMQFREEVLLQNQRIELSLASMDQKLNAHIGEDKSQFTNMNIAVDSHEKYLRYFLGGAGFLALLGTIGGIIMWLIDKLSAGHAPP